MIYCSDDEIDVVVEIELTALIYICKADSSFGAANYDALQVIVFQRVPFMILKLVEILNSRLTKVC